MQKPYSQACENNKDPILDILGNEFARSSQVLEVGAGTGQHAVHFAAHLPHLQWLPTDLRANLPGIQLWLNESGLGNLLDAAFLDVTDHPWPFASVDAVFSANTAHIMNLYEVEHMFLGIGELLPEKGSFCLYGPFNYDGQYTSESNARFDQWLQEQSPSRSIRDIEVIATLGDKHGLALKGDHTMPANNRLLIFKKSVMNSDSAGDADFSESSSTKDTSPIR